MTATTNSLPTVANTPSPLGASDWNKFRKFVEFIELINWGEIQSTDIRGDGVMFYIPL